LIHLGKSLIPHFLETGLYGNMTAKIKVIVLRFVKIFAGAGLPISW
jgi:hypothetical protein